MAFSLRTLVNVSELRYVDAVRTVVRTTFLIPLANDRENYVPSPSFLLILQFMLDLCYNEENFCLRRIYEKNTFYAIRPGHHYAWDCFTNTIYYASDGLV